MASDERISELKRSARIAHLWAMFALVLSVVACAINLANLFMR